MTPGRNGSTLSNPSKSKGTSYENWVLRRLVRVYGEGVSRSAANTESNDFHGVPWPMECKKRKTLAVPDWVRRIRKVAPSFGWVIWISDGDNRRANSFGEIAIVDANFMEFLLGVYEDKVKGAEH